MKYLKLFERFQDDQYDFQSKYADWEKGVIKAWGQLLYLAYHDLPEHLNNLVSMDDFKKQYVDYLNSDGDEDLEEWMAEIPPTYNNGKTALHDKKRLDDVLKAIAEKTPTEEEITVFRSARKEETEWNSYSLTKEGAYSGQATAGIIIRSYKIPKGFPIICASKIADTDEVIINLSQEELNKFKI